MMNDLQQIYRTAFLSIGIPLLFGTQLFAADNGFSISCEESKVAIDYNGKLVTNYLFRDEDARKPYFWPVIGPTGKPMTRAFPMETVENEQHDHPHHRGIWFGHQGVAGTDTWLEVASNNYKDERQKAFLASLGSIAHTAFTEISANDEQAVIRSNNDYLDSSGKQLMADQRSMIFQMSDGKLVLDFNITLLAKYGAVELEDKKDAGLNVRVPTSMSLKDGEGHIVNSVGDRDGDTWSKSAAWVDYHGPVQGEQMGIAFLNHPSSFRHPTRWHVRDYGLFTANPFGPKSLDETAQSGTFTLKNGESVHLRHRIIIHEGDEVAAGIAEAYRAYAASNVKQAQRVLCYGDSITAANPGWVAKIDKADSIETLNAGRGGRRAANALAELKPYLEKYRDERVDRILLCLGVNDLPSRDVRPGDVKVDICVQGMSDVIDLSMKRFAPEQIVLVAPCNVNASVMSEANLAKGYQNTQPLLEKLEAAYRNLADQKGVSFLSLLDVVSQTNYIDGLHPNDAGHQEIANVVQAFLNNQ